ncbi:winged helix-turn-helix domain-containing protein [Kitasatospora sp. NPDC004240]
MSSTATLPLPTATPHLRAVRSLHPANGTPPHATPSHAGLPHTNLPHATGPAGPVPAALPPQSLLAALPEGATVIAAVPQTALPQALLAQYGAQFAAQFGTQPGAQAADGSGRPMVGYLVLVPAETADPPARPQPRPVAAAPSPAAAVRPVRPVDRGIAVDVERRNAHVDGRLLDLTYLEFELLAHLTEHPQRVHTRDHLVSAVWGYGHVGDGRTVDVHVARLRRKLGPAYRESIVTVRRVGYKYTPVA